MSLFEIVEKAMKREHKSPADWCAAYEHEILARMRQGPYKVYSWLRIKNGNKLVCCRPGIFSHSGLSFIDNCHIIRAGMLDTFHFRVD